MKNFFTPWRLAIILLCCCNCVMLQAQDIHLSQFYETPLLRNPSLAGIFTGDFRVQAVYRNQWNSVTIPYETGALSGEVRFPVGQQHDYLTLGIQLTYDEAGSSHLKSTQFLPCLNYHKSLSEENNTYLSIGFLGGLAQRQFDPSKLTFDNQYDGNDGGFDPNLPSGENLSNYNQTYLDAAAGLSFSSTAHGDINYFIGAAYYHFNDPKVSFFGDKTIELSPKWEFNAGVALPVSDQLKFVGQFNQLHQGTFNETIVGGLFGYGLLRQGVESNMILYGGLFLRWKDAVIPVVKLDLGKYEIGMSYDVNTSRLKTASQGFGGFEISLSLKGFFTSQNSSLNKVNCPRF